MGQLERDSAQRTRRERIRQVALSTVQAAGLIGLMVAVPNALGGFQKLGLLPGVRQKQSLQRSYRRLVKNGYLKFEGRLLRITPKGERELLRLELEAGIPRKRKWDGKWRVLTFDIPERKKGLRERVRRMVQDIGFLRLQDSVWVYPFDCEDLITLLKAELRVGLEAIYMIVDQIEGDTWLRTEFDLPNAS